MLGIHKCEVSIQSYVQHWHECYCMHACCYMLHYAHMHVHACIRTILEICIRVVEEGRHAYSSSICTWRLKLCGAVELSAMTSSLESHFHQCRTLPASSGALAVFSLMKRSRCETVQSGEVAKFLMAISANSEC